MKVENLSKEKSIVRSLIFLMVYVDVIHTQPRRELVAALLTVLNRMRKKTIEYRMERQGWVCWASCWDG